MLTCFHHFFEHRWTRTIAEIGHTSLPIMETVDIRLTLSETR